MTHHLSMKAICLAACLALAAAPAFAEDASKSTDPAFQVPQVANPIPAEAIKGLTIVEKDGRWLVSDAALQPYGILRADETKGTYWLRLPKDKDGQKLGDADIVPLALPSQAVDGGRTINIRHIRRPLGLSYVLGEDHNELVPPKQATRVARQLKVVEPLQQPVRHESKIKTALFWDPAMQESTNLAPISVKQPVMSPCAFRLSPQGVELRDPDFDMLAASYTDKGYDMWPLIDNNFDPKVTHEILHNAALQDEMVRELIGYAVLYQFKGYNLDFENINYSDRDALTAFVKKLSDAFHRYDIKVSMDVTAVSDSPNWSLVYDREKLAQSLDYVMLMAYDQVGRTSPIAGPNASYPWVRSAIEGTLQYVPADKLILGIPLYMRLWYESTDGKDLPKDISTWQLKKVVAKNVKDEISAKKPARMIVKKKPQLFVRTLTLKDSEEIMKKYKSYAKWDDVLQLHYMELPMTHGTAKIWFEDERSLKEKIKLIGEYGLAGASFWRKGFEPDHFFQKFAKHELL